MKTEIYIAGHKDFESPKGSSFIPIHVGRRGMPPTFCKIGDDTGDNISEKNDTFCELTALYWIWKNTQDQDYVGLFHYRRHLNLSLTHLEENIHGVIEYKFIDEEYIDDTQLTDIGIQVAVKNFDLILPTQWNVNNAGSLTMLDHYRRGDAHFINDYKTAIEIIKNKYPEFTPFIAKVNKSKSGYFTNIFIAKRHIFDNYCAWLFDILFDLEKRLELSNYSVQERRVFGYISEWLFNIYIQKYMFDNPSIKVKHLQRTFVHNTNTYTVPPEADAKDIIICMACNDRFTPYAGTTILSILENSSKEFNYNFYLFDGSISNKNKERLLYIISRHKNSKLNFIDPIPIFNSLKLPVHMHFSRDIYYRLYIPEIFKNNKKVIYIDSDVIVNKDISELFNTDMLGKSIAAVKDCVMSGFIKFKTKSPITTGSLEAEEYLKLYLGMKDPALYFQSGVLLFDINKSARKINQIKSHLENGKIYWFPDQDILNAVYEGDVHFIDQRWNVFHGNGHTKSFYEKLPASMRNNYFNSRNDPFIIHYAGENKPWTVFDVDFSEEFWNIARKTPWFESMLFDLYKSTSGSHSTNIQSIHPSSQQITFRDVGRALVNPFAPLGSKRRAIVRRTYHFIRHCFGR